MEEFNEELKPLPIGVENFEDMITGAYYYVDKTLFIKELIDKRGKVNLFTRPRRFGKTLNISMFQYYFENLKADHSEVFAGLKIMETKDMYREHQNRYPVIKMSLKGGEGSTFEMAYKRLKLEIGSEFIRHQYLLESDKLADDEKQLYQYLIKKSMPLPPEKGENKDTEEERELEVTAFSRSLKFLSECLERYYDKKVIILIDEYDVPLEKAHFRGFYPAMIDFLRSYFHDALKTNDSLHFAILTGCLRVSKETIFTGLNNLDIVSIASNEYGEYFGFTEKEMNQTLKYYGLEEKEQEAKDWFNGYLFGDTVVYNPWSSIKYLKDMRNKEPFPKAHWANTSSNAIIRELISVADDQTKKEIEHLMVGGTITKPIKEDIVYAEIMDSSDNLWNFLFFTGYLKKVSKVQKDETIYFEMKIPNREIKYIYTRHIREWFNEHTKIKQSRELLTAILEKDVLAIEDQLNERMLNLISYFDSHASFYHGFLLGILANIDGYEIKSNRETGLGRSDIFMKNSGIRKNGVVIELKVMGDKDDAEDVANAALAQIEEKKYAAELEAEGYRPILRYGIAFRGKECLVKVQDAST